MDAIELLKSDHQEVTKLFQRYSASRNGRGGREIVARICQELDVHTHIEEEIFYPAVREADAQLAEQVQEALREHARVKQQIAALQGVEEQDMEGMMTTLQQDVEHHVTWEEGEMFPRVAEVMNERQRAELGQRLQARKRELTGEAARPARRASARSRRAGTGRAAGAGRKTSSQRGRRTKAGRRELRSAAAKSRARKTKKKSARGGRRR
jgi:hemerythrin superfamily protein